MSLQVWTQTNLMRLIYLFTIKKLKNSSFSFKFVTNLLKWPVGGMIGIFMLLKNILVKIIQYQIFYEHCIVCLLSAHFRKKLSRAIRAKVNNIYVHQLITQPSIFRAKQNFFNQHNISLYTTGTTFCQHAFLFCAILNTFSQYESLLVGK